MKTRPTALCLSLCCAACVIDREIGERLDGRKLAAGAQATGVASPAKPPPIKLAPPTPARGPCCTALPATGLDDPDSQASTPWIAWDGMAWAVTWKDYNRRRPVIRMMAGDTPGAAFELDPGQEGMRPSAIAHNRAAPGESARTLLVLEPSSWLKWPEKDPYARLLLVDAVGKIRASRDIEPSSNGGTVVWSSALQAWAFASYPGDENPPPTRLLLLDGGLNQLPAQRELGVSLPDDSFPITVLSVEDRVITLLTDARGVHIRNFVGRSLDEPLPEVILNAGSADISLPTRPDWPSPDPEIVSSVAAAVVRDRVVIGAMDGKTVQVWSYDFSAGRVVDGPTVVGTSRHAGRLSMASDDQGGTAGLCFSVGDGPGDPDGLRFALVGPDGVPRGEAVTLAQGLRYVATCDVSAGGPDEYLVAFWNAAKETRRHSILARRVLVERDPPTIEQTPPAID